MVIDGVAPGADTPRYPSFGFGSTVGEFSGESQHPPESVRVGRRCILAAYPITDAAVWDAVAELYVHYFYEEPKTWQQEVDEVVARIMGLWVKHYDEESPLFEGLEEEVEYAISQAD